GLRACRYLRHDRDSKFCASFKDALRSEGVSCLALPPQSPNLNAFAERWVRSVRQECLSKLILFGEGALQHALNEFIEHFQLERNHQGKGNVLRFPTAMTTTSGRHIGCSERLGGLLRYYSHLRRTFALHHKSLNRGTRCGIIRQDVARCRLRQRKGGNWMSTETQATLSHSFRLDVSINDLLKYSTSPRRPLAPLPEPK